MTDPQRDPLASIGGARGGRLVAALVLVVVAFVGVASGVALDRTVLLPRRGRTDRFGMRADPGRGAQLMRDRLATELQLTEGQRHRLDSVMDRQLAEFRAARQQVQPRMDSIFAATRRAVDSILTPEQRTRLDSMRRMRAFGPPFPMPDRRRGGAAPEGPPAP